jgi:2-haloalkanoic acid dehalogenase type II
MPYCELLAEVHRRLALEWHLPAKDEDHQRFSQSVTLWPPFADTPAALRYLQQHYHLVILSNVDRQSFAGSAAQVGVDFSAVYTAQDIGSYKPDPANFRYLLDRLAKLGHDKSAVLHVAQSLFHDHAPAQNAGLATAWIDRRLQRGVANNQQVWGATMPPPASVRYDFYYPDLAALVLAHQEELAGSAADGL